MNKIPFDYHLKKMIKSNDIETYFKHAEYFFQQQFIELSFTIQQNIKDMYQSLDLMLDYNVR
jgi:hypothetical protein